MFLSLCNFAFFIHEPFFCFNFSHSSNFKSTPPTDGWKCQSNCAHQCESDCRTSGDGTDCDLDKVNMNGGHIMLCPVMSRIVFQMSACDQAIVVGFGEAARLKTPYLSCKY